MSHHTIVEIIPPLHPAGEGWVELSRPPAWVSLGYSARAFYHPSSKLCVISAVEVAADKDGIDRGPQYHISISGRMDSRRPNRANSTQTQWVLQQFGLEGAEEDNHVPHGVVRNFWRPIAERLIGLKCACKKDEPAISENKGDYIWRPAE